MAEVARPGPERARGPVGETEIGPDQGAARRARRRSSTTKPIEPTNGPTAPMIATQAASQSGITRARRATTQSTHMMIHPHP